MNLSISTGQKVTWKLCKNSKNFFQTNNSHPYKLEFVRMKRYNVNMAKIKTSRQMERHLKGMANHYRIEILLLIADREKITLEDIVKELEANEKTIGEHTRRLSVAGLLNRFHNGHFVELTLSPYGEMFVKFLKSFKKI